MSTPYPPPPKRLMRDPSRKLIGGVCSGLAKYLNMDVNLVRILTVLISLFTGIPIVLYIIALFVLPEERPDQQPPYVNGPQPSGYESGYTASGYTGAPSPEPAYGQPAYGQPAPPRNDDVWGSAGAPWEQPQASEPTRYDTAPVEPTADSTSFSSASTNDSSASTNTTPGSTDSGRSSESTTEDLSTNEDLGANEDPGSKRES